LPRYPGNKVCLRHTIDYVMETEINTEEKENKGMYWLITLVSLAAGIILLLVYPSFFWLALPFFLTYFVKAIGMM